MKSDTELLQELDRYAAAFTLLAAMAFEIGTHRVGLEQGRGPASRHQFVLDARCKAARTRWLENQSCISRSRGSWTELQLKSI